MPCPEGVGNTAENVLLFPTGSVRPLAPSFAEERSEGIADWDWNSKRGIHYNKIPYCKNTEYPMEFITIARDLYFYPAKSQILWEIQKNCFK